MFLNIAVFDFRTSLKRILTNIVDQKHDKDVCNINCIENGKVFNQKPYQCQYFTGSSSLTNLLEIQIIDDEDSSEATTKRSPNIAEYSLQMILLKEYMDEVNLGIRNQDDLPAQQKKTEEL